VVTDGSAVPGFDRLRPKVAGVLDHAGDDFGKKLARTPVKRSA
jgi:hypothetical protein